MAKTPGNIIRATAANFSANSTGASKRTPKSTYSRMSEAIQAVRNPPHLQGIFPRRGSARILMSGSAIPRTCAPGICSAMRAKRTNERGKARARPPPPAPAIGDAEQRAYEPCSPPKAAIGAGGTARNTVRPTTRNSRSSTASTSPKSTSRSANLLPTHSRIPSSAPERGRSEAPTAYLEVKVDGRESSYFEWLGAGLYATDHAQQHHARTQLRPRQFYYGFGPKNFYLRVDPFPEAIAEIPDFQCASRSGTRAKRASPCASKNGGCLAPGLDPRTGRPVSAAS